MDFILPRRGMRICFDFGVSTCSRLPKGNFASFSSLYPDACLVVIASDADKPWVNRAKEYVETGLAELEHAVSLAMEELWL
jgi:hypothetical protein